MPQGGYPIPPAELVVGPFGGELSLDYENEADRLLSMLSVEAIKEALESKGKSPEK